MSENILEVKNLYKSYYFRKNIFSKIKEQNVINNLSFELKEGEILGIVGSSGSGKSTLVKAILGISKLDKGEIYLEGEKIFGKYSSNKYEFNKLNELRIRKKIQIIMQDPYTALDPKRKVGSIAIEAYKLHNPSVSFKIAKEQIERYFTLCGLDKEYMNKYPHELSGGQSQRVCIAGVLALKPKIIICDEITSALDVLAGAKILNLMLDLREKFNLSYIFISHNKALIDCISDKKIDFDRMKLNI